MGLAKVKRILKSLTPPFIWGFTRRLLLREESNQRISFKYNLPSWEAASRKIDKSYADASILEIVRVAASRVKSGEYAYERDGVLFEKVIPNWQLNSLVYTHLYETKSRHLDLLDFGGGLGTTYFQFKNSVRPNHLEINWVVVEQENFVKVGQKDFSSKELQFVESLNLCNFRGEFIAIALGVFQYLKDPNEYLVRIIDLKPKYILIDATPFSPNGEESISIQIVPSSIYPSSYAAHVFSWKNLIGGLLNEYILVCDWDCVEQPDPRNVYRGGIFERKEQF